MLISNEYFIYPTFIDANTRWRRGGAARRLVSVDCHCEA